MEFYSGSILTLTIDGEILNCDISDSLSEIMSLAPSQAAPLGWSQSRPNLQSYQISVNGLDDGAYLFLRPKKRSLALVEWILRTPDLYINVAGDAYITQLDRTSPAGERDTFSAVLTGFGRIVNLSDVEFLLLEDGDFILLESGDRIYLENS